MAWLSLGRVSAESPVSEEGESAVLALDIEADETAAAAAMAVVRGGGR